MKKNSLFIFGLLAAFSCSKSEDAAPAPAKPCRISKITVAVEPTGSASSTTTYNFEYNSDNMLIKEVWSTSPTVSTTTYTYTYQAGEIASITDGSNTYTWTQLSGVVQKVNNKVFTYDGSGKLTNWTDVTVPSGYHLSATFTYTAANLATRHFTMDLSAPLDYTTTYGGYDSKSNGYSLLAEATSQPVYHWPDGGVEDRFVWKNNPGFEDTTGTGTGSFTYTYQYNAKGYPTKIIQASANIVITSDFEYITCN